MKRPVGVILSSVLLGCFATLQLLAALLYLFLAVTFRHGMPGQPPAPGLPTGPYLTGIMVFTSVFFAALAVWAMLTLIGLLRLREWARYSILTIGGCLAALGLLGVIASILASAFLPPTPATANLPPHTMQAVFLVMALVYAAVAALGIWWLIYFNLRSTKAVFLPALPPPSPYDPLLAPVGSTLSTAPRSRWTQAPPSIIVIACLFLLGALCCALIALLPFPAFLFGFVLHRPASLLLYALFAFGAALVGIGLLRMSNLARLGVYAFSAIGFINFVTLLTPWGQRGYNTYQQTLYASARIPGLPATQPMNTQALLIVSFVFCLILYAIQIWLLERHRAAFH